MQTINIDVFMTESKDKQTNTINYYLFIGNNIKKITRPEKYLLEGKWIPFFWRGDMKNILRIENMMKKKDKIDSFTSLKQKWK